MLGHWSLFFFYPADFTFVCPTELEDLADNYAKFKEIGCEIYSVSTATPTSCTRHGTTPTRRSPRFEYPMLADPTALLAKDLDTYNEADGVAERGDFIVSPEGKVVAYEVISSNVGRNAEELLRRVRGLPVRLRARRGSRSAPPTGPLARKPSSPASTSSASCDRH